MCSDGACRRFHASHAPSRRLKDIITNNQCGSHVYLVLECLDCDLRTYMNTCSTAPDEARVKVRAPGTRSACIGPVFLTA